MPIYVYKCESCSEQTEYLQKASDPPKTDCPNCEQPQLKKVIAGVGIAFKGDGFHINDYSSQSNTPSSSTSSNDSSSSSTN